MEEDILLIGNKFLFDRGTWDLINFIILGFSGVALIVAQVSKQDKTFTKVLHAFFIILVPLIGSLYVFIRFFVKKHKNKVYTLSQHKCCR